MSVKKGENIPPAARAAALSFLSCNISKASWRVSPLCRFVRELVALLPCLLYIRWSAAVYILFQVSSSSPVGVGAASGYLNLKGFEGAVVDAPKLGVVDEEVAAGAAPTYKRIGN